MAHIVEEAKSGRSKCRGCGRAIGKGEKRFGERLPNPFADDSEMTLWFHIDCAAMRRPESFSEVLEDTALQDEGHLAQLVEQGIADDRIERIAGIEQAPSGRARCRHCEEIIEKSAWRIPLQLFEEGVFNNSGFIHVSCATEYVGTSALMPRLVHFNTDLSESEQTEIASILD